jgi:YfiH family protein
MSKAWIRPEWQVHPQIHALITNREGGLSLAPYASLNLGSHVGDAPEAVKENRAILRKHLPSEPVWLNQVHGIAVFDADAWDGQSIPSADAVITTQVNRVLSIMTADCLPVLLVSTDARVIGAAHAGWRGLCAGVIEATVIAMRSKLSDPDLEVQAYLGPAIGPKAFEVGAEVRDAFIKQNAKSDLAFQPSHNHGKYLADIYQLARLRLHALGVNDIRGGEACTYQDQQFFSYRRDQVTGRLASLLWIGNS